jgi:hypothetical protein
VKLDYVENARIGEGVAVTNGMLRQTLDSVANKLNGHLFIMAYSKKASGSQNVKRQDTKAGLVSGIISALLLRRLARWRQR